MRGTGVGTVILPAQPKAVYSEDAAPAHKFVVRPAAGFGLIYANLRVARPAALCRHAPDLLIQPSMPTSFSFLLQSGRFFALASMLLLTVPASATALKPRPPITSAQRRAAAFVAPLTDVLLLSTRQKLTLRQNTRHTLEQFEALRMPITMATLDTITALSLAHRLAVGRVLRPSQYLAYLRFYQNGTVPLPVPPQMAPRPAKLAAVR